MHPYFIFEVLRTSTYLGHQVEVIDQRFDVEKKGRKRSFVLLYRTPKTSDMIALANRGYFLVIADEKGIKKVSDRKELQGKWMPLNHLAIVESSPTELQELAKLIGREAQEPKNKA